VTARWEIVATWSAGPPALKGTVVPISEGKHFRRTWCAARRAARRWTRSDRLHRAADGRAWPPPYRWIVRRRRP
jgi:hypothetical protein